MTILVLPVKNVYAAIQKPQIVAIPARIPMPITQRLDLELDVIYV